VALRHPNPVPGLIPRQGVDDLPHRRSVHPALLVGVPRAVESADLRDRGAERLRVPRRGRGEDAPGDDAPDAVGEIVDSLAGAASVFGGGQSSWGPTVYGVTDAAHADAARDAGRRALDAAGVGGGVTVVRAADGGARVDAGADE
jgi:predicted sugar kinase